MVSALLTKNNNKTMKKDVKCFLGMDVSKLWVDITLMRVVDHQKQPATTERFGNSEAGIKALDKWLRKQQVPFDDNSLLVIENTGVYHRLIWQYCSSHRLPCISVMPPTSSTALALQGVRMISWTVNAFVLMPARMQRI
jgi:hypothetical protein